MIFHKVKELDEMVDYNKDGVSVEKLLENGNFKAMLIALKKEQILPEHISEVDAFVYVLYGEIEFSINSDEKLTENIKDGEFFAFYADEKHSLYAKKDSKILVVRI